MNSADSPNTDAGSRQPAASVPQNTQTDSASQFARDVVNALRARGFTAFWAGGCVRDQLLGQTPKDYDVATNAVPEQIRSVFGRRRTLFVGAAFGVVTVLAPRSSDGQVEVATFRRDGNYSDGRHPDQVSFSDPYEDAQRRDFTINGLFYDPVANEVIDYVGGQEDLTRRVIRSIGDPHRRFDEDKLRMVRAVRFATTLDFEIDAETCAAIVERADEVSAVSSERIAAEMRRVLVHSNAAAGLDCVRTLNLWRKLLPEYAEQAESDEGQVWSLLLRLFQHLTPPWNISVAFAALLWPVTHRDQSHRGRVTSLVLRWKLTNMEAKNMDWLLSHVTVALHARSLPWPTLQAVLIDPRIGDLLQLTRAIIRTTLGAQASMDPLEYCEERLAWSAERLNPAPLLNGDDLREAGYPAGPEMGRLLTAIRHAQLDGLLTSRESALAWVAQQHATSRDDTHSTEP